MFAPMIAKVSSEVALRGGAVTVELDREVHAVVMTCEDHVVQEAVPLGRRNLPRLVHDFLTRHQACNRRPGDSHRVPSPRLDQGAPRR